MRERLAKMTQGQRFLLGMAIGGGVMLIVEGLIWGIGR